MFSSRLEYLSIRFVLVPLFVLSAVVCAAEQPNFVIINIDDLGYADIGPFGSTLNRTPNLDKMASEGMKLRCHYAAPVCSPSRSALMTGCYPKRVLPIPHVLFPAAAVGLNPEETTIAEVLKTKGYATGCIGKWHLGDQPEFMPTSQGFDYYFGIPYSNDMGMASEGSKSDLGQPLPKQVVQDAAKKKALVASQSEDESGLKGNNQPPLPMVRNLQVVGRVDANGQSEFTKQYANEATKFIEANSQKPFFLYLPHNAVHFPLYPSEAFHNKSKNGLLGDWVEEVDWCVGQVFKALRDHKLDQKTLVIFTSDNGGTGRSVNAPLRGNKGSTWEGGMRVPTIAWWPGKIAGGTSTDEVTSMMDFLPTFAAIVEAKLPEKKIDGGNIWPILSNAPNAKSPHDVFYFFKGLKLEAIRQGNLKLHLSVVENAAAKGKEPKARTARPGPRLYDLTNDIGESKDLSQSSPDAVDRLMELTKKMSDDLGLDGVGPGCRALGRVADPRPFIQN
jgi:arylsulfatase A